ETQGEIGGEHAGLVFGVGVEGVGDGTCAGVALRLPLLSARGALGQLPLVFKEVLEEVVAPLDGGGGPGDFEGAGDGVRAYAALVGIAPAEALVFYPGGFRVGADVSDGGCAVSLAEGVAAGDEGHGLFVVHGHAAESFAD